MNTDKPAATCEQIEKTITTSIAEVATWPAWKQNILSDSGKPMRDTPRTPVYNTNPNTLSKFNEDVFCYLNQGGFTGCDQELDRELADQITEFAEKHFGNLHNTNQPTVSREQIEKAITSSTASEPQPAEPRPVVTAKERAVMAFDEFAANPCKFGPEIFERHLQAHTQTLQQQITEAERVRDNAYSYSAAVCADLITLRQQVAELTDALHISEAAATAEATFADECNATIRKIREQVAELERQLAEANERYAELRAESAAMGYILKCFD